MELTAAATVSDIGANTSLPTPFIFPKENSGEVSKHMRREGNAMLSLKLHTRGPAEPSSALRAAGPGDEPAASALSGSGSRARQGGLSLGKQGLPGRVSSAAPRNC